MPNKNHAKIILITAVAVVTGARGDDTIGLPYMPDRSQEVNFHHVFKPNLNIALGIAWTFSGGAVADFNDDGFPDAFVVSGGNSPSTKPDQYQLDRLFINQGDGTFANEAEAWDLTQIHCGIGAGAADYNSDGYVDLYVTSFGDLGDVGGEPGRNKLYRNNGGKSFTNVATEAGVAYDSPTLPAGYGVAWGDYNLDGHLDLHIACWWPLPSPQSSVLYRNNGDGTFTNATVEAGVYDNTVFGYQGAFADMNGNGWPDLLLAADLLTSRFYSNDGDGTFTNITHSTGTGVDFHGMGQAIADVNNDTLFDWYVTSIHTGSPTSPGNTLYMNQGNNQYIEMGYKAGVIDGGWGWGTVAVDLNHNTRVDLVEVNGQHAMPWAVIPPRLFYNNGDTSFTDIAIEAGMFHQDQGRGLARIDANRDGLQDLIVMNYVFPSRFYRNETANAGNWIGISFDTSNNPLLPPNGYNTHVRLTANGAAQVRYMHGDPSYLATSELNVHFGLGAAQVIEEIVITWPRGYVTTLHNVPVNQYLEVASPSLADLNADGIVGVPDLLKLLSLWGAVISAHDLHADMNNDGIVGVADLLLLLAQWGS